MDENTLKELQTLRDSLKAQSKTENGRTATICTDRTLENLAMYNPRTLDEMRTIDGIGDDFVEKYGQQFLDVLNRNRAKADKSMEKHQMTDRQAALVKELEKNLVDVSRRNKLLYTAKSQAKYSQDLYSANYDVRELIFRKKNSITICTRSDSRRYTGFTGVLREATRDLREKGRNDLYIGYPFVKGKMQGEGFEVRAPLLMIPVKADKSAERITIRLDEDRDALFNNTLILAFHKYNNIRRVLPDPELEEYTEESFINLVLSHYSAEGLEIQNDGITEIIPFLDYKAGEFPKYELGEMYLENVAVLGKFTIQTSSIHKDYEQMLENNEINGLLDNLLDTYDANATEDTFYGDTEIDDKTQEHVLEKDMVYINDLNGSQEKVLRTVETTDELVIQGPPGTGKSQTIASLIVDSVNKGKTVLMVSEKKTALDVVYSRLGILSKYAIQIDDIGDKESFYSQMDELINIGKPAISPDDLNALSAAIDSEVGRLEELATALYTPDSFGIEPYQLYHFDTRIDASDDAQYKAYKMIEGGAMTQMKFSELKDSFEYFQNPNAMNDLCAYKGYLAKCPTLGSFSKSLGSFDMRAMEEDIARVNNDIEVWKKKFFLFRIFGKGAVTKEVGGFVDKYLPLGSRDDLTRKIMTLGFDDIKAGMGDYDEYVRTCALFDTATDAEKKYLDTLVSIKAACPEIADANGMLYNQIINWHIDDFKKRNTRVFNTIDDFSNIVERIGNYTMRKKELSVRHTEQILQNDLFCNLNDLEKKGCKELHRKVEGKRKKSVNLFVRMFSGQLFNGIRIWLMTPEVVSEVIPFEKGRFDLLIFDEASQMYREKGLPAIYRAKKVVIAGDDKQLRPSSVGKGRFDPATDDEEDLDAALEESSLLDLAKSKYTPVLLDYHYRSRYEELINFSNYAFYKGRLYVSPNVGQPAEPPIKMHIVDGVWADRSNRAEAEKVVELIREFFDKRQNNETLGIITFNINQRDLIERLIEEECAKDPAFDARYDAECARRENGEDIGLFIRSIENVQGDERDEIIFSVAYAKDPDGRFRRNFGTLNQESGENRLNVAITRAKRKVQIVTSMNPSEFDVSGISAKGPFFLRKYLEYSYAISEGNKEQAKNILLSFHDQRDPGSSVRFDSDFEEQVYDALKEQGLEVDTQIGVGGYSIDLAVKKNGKYVLGIECDGKLYHSSASARERDYHRQKYLESRGWRIHRIWSTNWWYGRDKEVQKIVSLVNSL